MKYCPECQSLLEYSVCSNMRCPGVNNALKAWIIDGIEYEFKESVTYEKAVKLKQQGSKLIKKRNPPISENQNKIWVNSPTW